MHPNEPLENEGDSYTQDELEAKTVEELKEIAKTLEMTGYSGLNKAELIAAILGKINE